MNWPDDVVEKCNSAARESAHALAVKIGKGVITATNLGGGSETIHHPDWFVRAALSAITLRDIAKLPEVKAWLSGGILITDGGGYAPR